MIPKEYQVTISAVDAGGKSIAHNFTIEVINSEEKADVVILWPLILTLNQFQGLR